MDVKSTADLIAKSWEKRAKRLGPVMRKATTECTKLIYAEAQKELKSKIYDKPVPSRGELQQVRAERAAAAGKEPRAAKQRAKGWDRKPAWRRTGNLRRSERYRVASNYLGIVYNDAEYARDRHERGKPGNPPVYNKAHWRDVAIAKTRKQRIEIYRAALREQMSDGIIQGL